MHLGSYWMVFQQIPPRLNYAGKKMGDPVKVIVLEIPDAVMMNRLKDGENFNDTEETIQKRIKTYNDETRPIIGENSKFVVTIKADRPAAEVFGDVKSALG